MTSTLVHPTGKVLDLREIAARERHAMVFNRFGALRSGEALELLSDHNPQPLRYQFDDRCPGQFAWSALDAGPTVWRVQITRVASEARKAAAPAGDSCCSGGACRG